ncbi:MAG TPA: hypothetical protein VNZ64_09230 [Candidatus Acidoferrum sp.]|jgi:hypothetical protein|nr:hypothetical protein [Candidatus Acidoferrum sp.]
MDAPDQKKTFAWQPLTPRGVAAFASASLARLLCVQCLVALAAAGIVVWFLHTAWFPPVINAIRQLPDRGQIQRGLLDSPAPSPSVLAQGRFLAFSLDLQHEGNARPPAHLLVEFGRSDFKVFSLLGYLQSRYPPGRTIPFNRPELQPWWGAWSPVFLALAATTVVAALMLTWALLATLYALPAWLLAFFADRHLPWRASWRLAGAALIPGALFMSGAILCYGLGALDLVKLGLAAAVHLLLGWAYLLASPFCLPRHPTIPKLPPNPFSNP